MRGKAIELVSKFPRAGTTPENIENTKSTFRRQVELALERLRRLRERVGQPVAALAETRAEYEELLNDPDADPDRKKELEQILAAEKFIDVESRVYVVARIDLEIKALEQLDDWIARLDTESPSAISVLRRHFEFYDMVLGFADAATEHAELMTRAIEGLELARITATSLDMRLLAPLVVVEYVGSGGSPSSFFTESPLVTSVQAQFEAYRDAPRPTKYYASNTVDAYRTGRADLAKYRTEINEHRSRFDKASKAEWSRLNRGWRYWVANILEIVALYEAGVGLVSASPSLAALFRATPALLKGLVKSSARGLRMLATNPRKFMTGGYRALVDALKRGYRLGTEGTESAAGTASRAPGVVGPGNTRAVARTPRGGGGPSAPGGRSTARPAGPGATGQGSKATEATVSPEPKGVRPADSGSTITGAPRSQAPAAPRGGPSVAESSATPAAAAEVPVGGAASGRTVAPGGRAPRTPRLQRYLRGSGGRWGGRPTRQLNDKLATELEARGFEVTGGAGRGPEEWIPGPGGGTSGGTFVDITATNGAKTIRVQTVDTLADGVRPTPREAAAAARIRAHFPSDELRLVPKPKVTNP